MKHMNKAKKFGAQVLGVSVVGTGLANAAIPTEVTTALTDAATDSAGVASLFLIAIIGIAAYKLMQRGAS